MNCWLFVVTDEIECYRFFIIFANLYEIFKISPYNEFEIKKGYERL